MASVIDRPPSDLLAQRLGRQRALDERQDGVDSECEHGDQDGAGEEALAARSRARPSTMKRPRPPYERTAPMVAVAMTCSVAVRKPPTMTAIESGSSTRRRIWRPVMPMPAAGLDQVAVHGPQARVPGHEDGRDAEQEHGQEDGDEAKPDLRRVAEDGRQGQRDGQDGDHQRERRHGPADVGGVDGQVHEAAGMADVEPDGQADDAQPRGPPRRR